MARSSVLRRAASAVVNWRRQCVPGANCTLGFALEHDLTPRLGAVSSFLGFPGGNGSGNGFTRRNVCSSATLGTAVLDECNNVAQGSAGAPAAYNPATGTYCSQKPPLKLPEDPCMDVTSFIFEGKEKIGSRPALVDARSGESMTYNELQHVVAAVELGLVGMGVHQGDVVMILSENSIHYPVVFLATTSVGGVLATLNPLNTASEAKKQAELAGARYIIVEEAFLDKVSDLGLPLVIIERGKKVKVGSTVIPFSELLASDPASQSAPAMRILQDDPAAILYSSGTTGPTKGALLSHKNIIAQLLQLEMLDEAPETAAPGAHLCALPMSHVFGLVVVTLQQLYRGGTVLVAQKFDTNEAISLIDQHKVTHLYAVPSIIINLIKIMTTTTSPTVLSSLQRIMCGGAPLGKEQVEEFCKLVPDAAFQQIYGLTEVAGVVALNNLKENQFPGSVGTLLSSIEAKVLGADKEPLAPNAQGELHLRGPNVMQGYVNNAEATAATLDKQGWLNTGDLVSFDEEGRLFVVDRIKELIKYKAYQVAPAELEALLLSHPHIVDAAVVPVPSEEVGQIPVAFVVQSSEHSMTEDEVKEFIAQRVAPYKKVRQVLFVDDIPKTFSGKILRKDLAGRLS